MASGTINPTGATMDTLFTGRATNNQTVTLNGNIREYKMLIATGYMNNNSERVMALYIPVPAITAATVQFMVHVSGANASYYNTMKLYFPTDTTATYLTEAGSWASPPLIAIYGLK